ncbi:MAG: hypothetical protein CUN55_04780 [Phototrophicales bacterium]|nr:MAG: hypothetical protein CUN55_04780 [Phototrophicales bacterium]
MMTDELNNGKSLEPMHKRLIEDAYRSRTFSLDAVRERVIAQFLLETSGRDDLLTTYADEKVRRQAIRDAAEYVIATEYLILSTEEKRWLLQQVHDDIFQLGVLSNALQDPTITEISISNRQEIAVRHGFGELEPYDAAFDSSNHLEQLLTYALALVGVQVGTDPFLEVGLTLAKRIIRLSLTGPPVMPSYSGLIRLHPFEPLTFEKMSDIYPETLQDFLQRIILSGYGLIIVGEGGMGKTTLLGNLLQFTPPNTAVVQRAAEIHPTLIPLHVTAYNSIPKQGHPTLAFESQIQAAIQQQPLAIFIDEIQGDEEKTFWPLLHATNIQVVMTFRGRSNPRRLHSALSMAIRKADRALPQEEIDQVLLNRLPFVVFLSQLEAGSAPRVELISQWAMSEGNLILEPLLVWSKGQAGPQRTHIPSRLSL